jgi:ubiquitin carboxyl-terminal hydrolase 25/28
MNTAEQALKWLDPSYNGTVQITDQGITTLAAVKNHDATQDVKDQVMRAVKLIADDRNSEYLRMFAATGEVPAMSAQEAVNEAFAFFNITDRSVRLDDGHLGALRSFFLSEEPHRAEDIQKHYTALLNHFNDLKPTDVVAPEDYEHPVGLGNLGATCYLNSLLQYYFAIKPFRDIVRNYDEYKQDLEKPQLGRVGGTSLTLEEVTKAQECMSFPRMYLGPVLTVFVVVPELAALFDQMASGPGPVVNPEWKLAELALKQLDTGPLTRRNTIVLDPQASSAAPSSDPALFGPVNQALEESVGDASSDVTLIGDTVLTPDTDADENQKESPADDKGSTHSKADSMEVQMDDESQEIDKKPTPPSRSPPPIPPRHPKGGTDTLAQVKRETENAAAMQDVHEVNNKILFQTQCAIAPERIDEHGNQINPIREYVRSSLFKDPANQC